jgi:hypothetical protein
MEGQNASAGGHKRYGDPAGIRLAITMINPVPIYKLVLLYELRRSV